MDDYKLRDLDHYMSLWKEIYAFPEGPRWDHILPYYSENIFDNIRFFAKGYRRFMKRKFG